MFQNAKWITSKEETTNILIFRREFLTNEEITKATLRICGLGFYDVLLNGIKFEQNYFKPVVSDYKYRKSFYKVEKKNEYFAYFDTYDLTNLVDEKNLLEVNVSTGYFHNLDKKDFNDVDYGKTRLIFELEITYKSGKKELISSNEETLVAISLNKSNFWRGDKINFNEDIDKLIFEPSNIINEEIILKESPIRSDEVIDVYDGKLIKENACYKMFDFSKNHSGRLGGIIKGRKNQKIVVRFGEVLNEDGSLNTKSSSFFDFICPREEVTKPFYECKKPKECIAQEDEYILSGRNDIFPILFSYRCYRYVEIISDEPFEVNSIQSKFISMNLEQTISLEIDNPILQDIFDKGIQTIRCNLHNGFLTDCPHREKLPYTGDGNIVEETLLMAFDSEDYLSKWLDDILCSQLDNGFIPYTAPDYYAGGGYYWSYAVVKVPLLLYKKTGKVTYLKRSLVAIEKFLDYLKSRDNGAHILDLGEQLWQLPDWLAPMPMEIDPIVFNTACYFDVVSRLVEIYQILGKDEKELIKLKNDIKTAINSKYFNKETFVYSNDKQGVTVFLAYLGVVEDKYINCVNNAIKEHYEKLNYHLDTGIIITPILMEYLTINNMKDVAWKIMTQEDYPSFSYMLKNETTFPEHWSKYWISFSRTDGDEIEMGDDVSHSHPMYTAIISWIIKYVIGIDLSKNDIDYNNINPMFNEYVNKFKLITNEKIVEYSKENGLKVY